MTQRWLPPWWYLGLVLALSACELPDFLGETDEGPPLPGRRIAILSLDRGIEADPRLADAEVRLPEPYVNAYWSQPGGIHTHAMYHLTLEPAPSEAWSVDVGEEAEDNTRILAQPIVVGDFLFTMDAQSIVSGYNARNGRRIWRIDLRGAGEDEGYFGGGIAYAEEKLFVATGFAKVFALDARRGDILWQQRVPGPVRGGPAVSAGRVFVITIDNQTIALDTADGSYLWTHAGIQEIAGVIGSATPAVSGRAVVAPYSSGELVALTVEEGSVLWAETLAPLRQLDPLQDIAQIRGLPVIDRGVVFAISHAGRMISVDLEQGVRLWDIDVGGIQMPWAGGDFLYVLTNDSQLVCLRRKDGRIRWVRPLPRYEDPDDQEDVISWFGPVLASDRLIVAGSHGEALSVSPYSGEVLGYIDLPGGAVVTPVVANKSLYFLTEEADLVALR